MKYDSVENPERFNVLEKGIYEAQLINYEDKISKQGNAMCELTLKVYHDNGEVNVRDWLVNTSGGQWKIKNFADAVGQEYNQGELDMDMAKTKLIRVAIVKTPFKKDNGEVIDTNKIDSYLPLGEPKPVGETEFEDVF